MKIENLDYPQVWFTYGPQTKEDQTIKELLSAGATGARLTFSYGTPDLQAERAKQIKTIAADLGIKVFLVADLQGEKCRLAKIDKVEEIAVKNGDRILLTGGAVDTKNNPYKLPLQIPSYLSVLMPGDIIVEGDGAMLLEVLERNEDGVLCAPRNEGTLHPGRGIIVQKPAFRPAPLTGKDKSDLIAIAESGLFDAVAVSFVGRSDDISEARNVINGINGELPFIAKIETQLGIDNIESVTVESDMVMAARGDLALTAPWQNLYAYVCKIADCAKVNKTPWIIATQLAEGLERFVFPTRAEICDLAHWVENGASGVMLSYETAFGPRPVDAVKAVRSIVDRYSPLSHK